MGAERKGEKEGGKGGLGVVSEGLMSSPEVY